MSGFLVLLVKVNLVMAAAIVLVSLIRRPLRTQFGAPIAYVIWVLVPIASVASLLPPREVSAPAQVASVHAPAAPVPITGHTAHSALRAIGQLNGQSALMLPAPMKPLGSTHGMFDTSLLLFWAWALGALFMAAYLTRVQIHLSAAVRQGQAGPAVLGFFHPRIVTPDGFQEQFTPQEQSAILAHERVHLARQDARINALAAFLRCFCWFNPLIHLGARWLRMDQELACDATTVSGAISRRDYSMALLKSQVMVGILPFGCNWPGPQHPLVERIALLQRKPPGTARRIAGAGLVVLAATSAGLAAWAAQPPVATKPVARQVAMAPATLPAMIAAPDQAATETLANANPTNSGNDVDASRIVRADRAVPVLPRTPSPKTVSIKATTQFAVTTLPQMALVPEPKIIADDQYPTGYEVSSEPKDRLAKNTVAGPATGDGATTDPGALAGPHPKTEPALQCVLGFGPDGCATRLWGHPVWGLPCCADGPLERVDYLGTNALGEDVYDLQYRHTDMTIGIAPPGPDGKMGQGWSKRGNPNAILPSFLADVSSSDAQKMTLYRRWTIAAAETGRITPAQSSVSGLTGEATAADVAGP